MIFLKFKTMIGLNKNDVMEGCEMRKCCLIVYNLYVVLSVVAYRMPYASW